MTAFQLLHGAWHGAWVWDDLAVRLQHEGFLVNAPDLPGMGTDANNLHRGISLEDHIQAATPAVPSVLIGHSYAGMLVRAIANRYPQLVSGIVLIESLWPDHGQSVFDIIPAAAKHQLTSNMQSDSWDIPPPDVSQFQIPDSTMAWQIQKRLTPQPLQTYTDNLALLKTAGNCPTGTYIISTDRNPQPYTETALKLKQQSWQIKECSGGHELMLTATNAVFDCAIRSIDKRTSNAT